MIFDVIAYKVLKYIYTCMKQGVQSSIEQAQEIAFCGSGKLTGNQMRLKEQQLAARLSGFFNVKNGLVGFSYDSFFNGILMGALSFYHYG